MPRPAASPIVRTTYALDLPTIERLDRLAQNWNLSRSAALRRIILEAPEAEPKLRRSDPRLDALRRLQAKNTLTQEEVNAFNREVLLMRKASTRRRLPSNGKRR